MGGDQERCLFDGLCGGRRDQPLLPHFTVSLAVMNGEKGSRYPGRQHLLVQVTDVVDALDADEQRQGLTTRGGDFGLRQRKGDEGLRLAGSHCEGPRGTSAAQPKAHQHIRLMKFPEGVRVARVPHLAMARGTAAVDLEGPGSGGVVPRRRT
jgi:hypothetical protein